MRRLRAGDEETILVCPICDSAMIRRRFPDKQQSRNLPADADRWYCRVGQHAFAQPTERPPRASQSTNGLAKRLEDADPDDVGLRTDGGLDGACPKCGSDDYDREDDVVCCPDCGFTTGHITDGGLVEACPECESSNINQRQFPRTPDEEWFCLDCREAFGEPIHRPPKQPGGNYSAIGKRLIEADPDDLRTDGGAVDSYQLWLGEDCPECGVEIDEGSLRFNGRAWEHKNPETHPQAGHHVIRETIGEEVRTDGGQRTLADAAEPGMVGTCTECEGQLVETLVVLADSGVVVLNCQDCDAEVRVEYQLHEQNPWDVAEDVGGICDPSVASIAWVDCQRCDGHGDIPDPICDLRRSMNGREHPCPECDATGSVPRVVKTDGGVRRRHPGDGAETLAGVGDQDPGCPHGDVACARGDVPCWDCLVGGDET
jgi:hypothetical protein